MSPILRGVGLPVSGVCGSTARHLLCCILHFILSDPFFISSHPGVPSPEQKTFHIKYFIFGFFIHNKIFSYQICNFQVGDDLTVILAVPNIKEGLWEINMIVSDLRVMLSHFQGARTLLGGSLVHLVTPQNPLLIKKM